jgi:hypothetical protein
MLPRLRQLPLRQVEAFAWFERSLIRFQHGALNPARPDKQDDLPVGREHR